jgi:hypothetical protein
VTSWPPAIPPFHFHPCPWHTTLPMIVYHVILLPLPILLQGSKTCKQSLLNSLWYGSLKCRSPCQRCREWGIKIKFRVEILNLGLDIFCRQAGKGKAAVVAAICWEVWRTGLLLGYHYCYVVSDSCVIFFWNIKERLLLLFPVFCVLVSFLFMCLVLNIVVCFRHLVFIHCTPWMLGYPTSILGSIANQQQSQRRGLLPPPSTQKYYDKSKRVRRGGAVKASGQATFYKPFGFKRRN